MALEKLQQGSTRDFGGAGDLRHLASNAASFGILASAGIAINAILAVAFDVTVVGQFNQLFALHVVAAQLAAFGIHLSSLHYLSGGLDGKAAWMTGARAAILAVAGMGLVVATVVWICAGPIARLFDSPALIGGIQWLAPAVALFGVNKVLLAICNSCNRLHALAFLQAMRPVCWLAGVMALVGSGGASPTQLGQILLFGEGVTVIAGLIVLRTIWHGFPSSGHGEWLGRHLVFGLKAMPSNLIIDLNTRIDVLVLAFFASDAVVGVYSFVALIAEGVFQIGVVIRTVVSRRLVGLLVGDERGGLRSLRRQAGRWSLGLTVVPVAVVAAAFVPTISYFGLDLALAGGVHALWVLLGGVAACAMYAPMWMVLVLAGHPVRHTQLMLALCALNLALNVALIPAFGMLGAAAGTAVMLAAFPLMLRVTVKRTLGVDL